PHEFVDARNGRVQEDEAVAAEFEAGFGPHAPAGRQVVADDVEVAADVLRPDAEHREVRFETPPVASVPKDGLVRTVAGDSEIDPFERRVVAFQTGGPRFVVAALVAVRERIADQYEPRLPGRRSGREHALGRGPGALRVAPTVSVLAVRR